jgi:hypothetical protein
MEDRLSSSSSADVPSNYYYEPKSQEITQTKTISTPPDLTAVFDVLGDPLLLFDIGLLVIGQGTIVVLPALRSAKWVVSVSRRVSPTIVRQMIRRCGAAQGFSRLVTAIRQRMRNAGQTLQSLYKNRSRVSVLSDYTWYVNASSSSPGEHIVDDEKVRA